MNDLTKRQRQILDFLRVHVEQHGYPPSVREIGQQVGLSSSSTVHGHLARLEARGLIRRDPTKPRAIELLGAPAAAARRVRHVPVVGTVAAGAPILAAEDVRDTFPLPYEWVHDDDAFLLDVRGDSMIEAGILTGDQVIVRRQSTAANGEIVVALIGDEATVKRFFREPDRVRLQPENHTMEPIYVRDVQILGRVIGLVRRL